MAHRHGTYVDDAIETCTTYAAELMKERIVLEQRALAIMQLVEVAKANQANVGGLKMRRVYVPRVQNVDPKGRRDISAITP